MSDNELIAGRSSRRSFLKVAGAGIMLHSAAASYARDFKWCIPRGRPIRPVM